MILCDFSQGEGDFVSTEAWEALIDPNHAPLPGNEGVLSDEEIISKFPLQAARSTSEVTYSNFKQLYLARLSEEIGRLFYEYYNGDDIPDAI